MQPSQGELGLSLSFVVLLWLMSLDLPHLLQPEETLELPPTPSSTRALLKSRGATWGVGFTLSFARLSPVATSQLPETRGGNGQGCVGPCEERTEGEETHLVTFPVSSPCSPRGT